MSLHHAERKLQGVLLETLSDSALEVDITNPPNASYLPTWLTIEPGTGSEEVVEVTAVSGATVTIARAKFGTSAIEHQSNAAFEQTNEKEYHEEIRTAFTAEHSEAGVHDLGAGNLLKNGNFINNFSNGYGGVPEDWADEGHANPVQGGIPTLTKAQLISLLGITDAQIEGLWPLNEASGNALDLSANGYDLTDTNTVGSSLDGLMARARDLELADSEYFTLADASCANLEISGSQTWFGFVKAESIAALMQVMAKADTTGVVHALTIESTGKVTFELDSLTTNSEISSDIVVETGKLYFICGVYDSVNTKLKIWVNGVKKEVTASGSAGDTDAGFCIGADLTGGGDAAANFYDGLIQNSGILSVALSDDQVKRLWAYTQYKGIKTRRATTDGYIYQDLPQDLVERLRGKKLTVVARAYQDTASIAQISIYDGSTETESATVATVDSWLDLSAKQTIGADAVSIQIRAKVSTSDGNAWFKELALYEGDAALPYNHSGDDWERFPSLLKMAPSDFVKGYENEGIFIDKIKEKTEAAGVTVDGLLIKDGLIKGDSAIKAWINFNGTGTIAISGSFNVTSITDNGTGDYTITWDTDFANANYACTGLARIHTVLIQADGVVLVGSIRILTQDHGGSASDPAVVMVVAIGDQ